MGTICSCLCSDDSEELVNSEASSDSHCICFRSLVQQLIQLFNTCIQREETRTDPLLDLEVDTSTSSEDTSISDFHSPPTPLPYDDPRCYRHRHKCDMSSQPQRESEAIRVSSDITQEMNTTQQCSGSSYEEKCNLDCLNSTSKNTLGDVDHGMACSFPSYEVEEEDEDVCPTCLEEYAYENPRIILKCSHHFHLSCIYEWKERSELCPVCCKVMEFNET